MEQIQTVKTMETVKTMRMKPLEETEPKKRCTGKCGGEYPENGNYFWKNGKGKYKSKCINCMKAENREKRAENAEGGNAENQIAMKKCRRCSVSLPDTEAYFYRSGRINADGNPKRKTLCKGCARKDDKKYRERKKEAAENENLQQKRKRSEVEDDEEVPEEAALKVPAEIAEEAKPDVESDDHEVMALSPVKTKRKIQKLEPESDPNLRALLKNPPLNATVTFMSIKFGVKE